MVDVVYLEIDGSLHEGGGQVTKASNYQHREYESIRNKHELSSMALSNILQKPIQLKNIRISRPNPGLNNQLLGAVSLLAVIKLMREITKAEVDGDKNKSMKIAYQPQIKVRSAISNSFSSIPIGNYTGGSHSASAISLMVQSLIPTLIYGKGKSSLKLNGGTDVNKSPPYESIQRILKPLLQKMGVHFEYNLITEGYYPRGGGVVQLEIDPIVDYIKPITLTKRNIVNKIYIQFILTVSCKKPQKEYFRPLKKDIINFLISQQEGVKEEDIEFEVEVKEINNKKYNECYAIVAHAYGEDSYFAFSYYNDANLNVEDASTKVYENFVKELSDGGCLDEYHQDQLLLFMGLANGESQIRVNPQITEHSLAGFYVLQQFLPDVKIEIVDEEIDSKKSKLLKIKGVGLKNE